MDKVDEDAGGTIRSDVPIPGIYIRLPSPVRKKATKRSSTGVHEEEPDLKVVIRDDGEEDIQHEATHIDIGTPRGTQVHANMDATTPTSLPGDFPDPDMAMTSLSSFDKYVVSRCLLGVDMSECVARELLLNIAERVGQVLAVDILEMYSPERVAE